MDVLQAGIGEFSITDPDDLRAFMRTEKRRAMVDKVMPEAEAVRYVKDGDYVSFDFSSFTRGPASLVREIVRQRRTQLWFAAKFSLMETTLLAAGGCLWGLDAGFLRPLRSCASFRRRSTPTARSSAVPGTSP